MRWEQAEKYADTFLERAAEATNVANEGGSASTALLTRVILNTGRAIVFEIRALRTRLDDQEGLRWAK